ncbi:hypothetical protein [Geminicoccus harenae]|uniref:hypothetical protein n=1 Tax=Geminicoccus harenae TaxID=2498453 RepID=UPI00168BC141|nr:hypothetical protein [Geminicoccus harenae]
MLHDPNFRPDEPERALLESCVHASVLRRPAPIRGHERARLSDRLATEAADALFSQLAPVCPVQDANHIRRNQPGYDFLVDGRIRVQLKGNSFVESIGWAHSPDPAAADLAVDLLLAVDLGVVLDGRVGRLAGKPIPVRPFVDYYLVPGTVVREWVAAGRRVNGRGAHIYLYKYPLQPGTKEEIGQTRELADWRGRFDVLASLLRS